MIILALPNAAATVITVTNTATSLEDLIRATTGNGGYRLPKGSQPANALFAQVLTNGVSYTVDGNTPTASTGFQANTLDTINEKGIDLSKVMLIRNGGTNATVMIQLAHITPDEV